MKRKYKVINPLKKSPGIYKISCENTDKVYIGETINLSQRIQKHFSLLRKNKHSNPILQNIFNKYKEETFSIEVLEYLNITDDVELKILEKNWQSKYPTCISLDSNEIFHIERSEEWKEKQRKALNTIRELVVKVCSKPIIIYNIKTKEFSEFSKISEGESLMERKHIDKNINKKIYIPYKETFVAFYKEDFTEDNIQKILKGNSHCGVYTIYNILEQTVINYSSKTEFSKHFSKSRNDKLWDYFNDNKLIDFNFNCLEYSIKSVNNFLNSNIKLKKDNKSATVNIKVFYEGLKEKESNTTLSNKLGINRHSLSDSFKIRSREEWLNLFDKVLSVLPLNPFKIGKSN